MGVFEVADGVYQIRTPLQDRFTNIYVIVGDGEAAIYDVGVKGTVEAYVMPALCRLGITEKSVREVILSHCDVDHYGDIRAARSFFPEARISAHLLDAAEIERFNTFLERRGNGFAAPYGFPESPEALLWCREQVEEAPLDAKIHGDMQISVGSRELDILHVPGHTLGHLAIYDRHTGSAIISDAVLGQSVDSSHGAPLFPPTYRHVGQYLSTIDQVGQLGAEALFTAHFHDMRSEDVDGFLDSSRHIVALLESAVLDAFPESGGQSFSLEQLTENVSRVGWPWPNTASLIALAFPVAGHLEHLTDRGVLDTELTNTGHIEWRLA